MKRKILLSISTFAVIALIVYAKNEPDNFSLAEDFPRGALIYAQTSDLPALIKLWNESKFKAKYTTSQNYEEFKNRHLGRKLASRWQEFNDAAGFPFDLETIAQLASDKAAIAVYDIGKLDFVFIAPMRAEIFAVTKFAQNQNNYTEQNLDDGITIYRMSVKADRGRQKQDLIFTNVKNRFILTTSEKLLVETLRNINGESSKNNLAAMPEFDSLREKIEPHLATVWVDQTALNSDYYFKRYWLMSDVSELKNYRSGIFDFDISAEGKLIERRKFLLARPAPIKSLTNLQATKMLSFLPSNVPFYHLETADKMKAGKAVENVIFEQPAKSEKVSVMRNNYPDYDAADYESFSGNDDYSSLGENFDRRIDEADESQSTEKTFSKADFSSLLQTAEPQAVLTFTDPNILPFPLFVEFRRAAVIHLAAPKDFDREKFESEIVRVMTEKILVSASGVKLFWETKNDNDRNWRELNLPMLGQTISYALLQENNLILTNDGGFLREISLSAATEKTEHFSSADNFSKLTHIDLTQREKSYDQVFAKLQKETGAKDFFTGNIGSLLDSLAEIKTIDIKRNYALDVMEEEIILIY